MDNTIITVPWYKALDGITYNSEVLAKHANARYHLNKFIQNHMHGQLTPDNIIYNKKGLIALLKEIDEAK